MVEQVPPTASTMAATPAATPWRAVFGSFIHRSEKMNPIAEKQVERLGQLFHYCPGSRFLNIFSMRSVIRKPLTMLVIEAKTATAPRTVVSVRLLLAGQQHRADDGDRGDGVGQRHERRVEQPRDAPDDVHPQEGGQHQDEEA